MKRHDGNEKEIKSEKTAKKEYKTPALSHLGEMKEITRYDVSVIVE